MLGPVNQTPSRTPARRTLPPAAVIGAAVLFGTTGTAQELGPDGTTPLSVGTLRIVVGAVALWFCARRLPPFATLRAHVGLVVLGAVGVAAYQPSFFAGTARSGVALGTVVALGSGPVFAGLIELLWLKRVPTRRWLAATAVTIAGGGLLVFSGAGAGGSVSVVGVAASLTAGASYAVYAIASKLMILRGVHSTVSLAWPFTLGALVLLPFVAGEPLEWVVSGRGVLMLAHLGVLTVGLAYYLYGWGLRTLDTSTAVTLTLAEPVTAALLAVMVLDERLRPTGWVGAALVMVGLAMVGGVRLRAFGRGWGPRAAPRSASSGTAAATGRRARRRPAGR
jgi:drug/metabolite transporter, DME family